MLGSRAVRLAISPMISFPRYERRHGSSQGRFTRRGKKYLDKVTVQWLFFELRVSDSTSLHLLQSSCISPCSCDRFPCMFVFCMAEVLRYNRSLNIHRHIRTPT